MSACGRRDDCAVNVRQCSDIVHDSRGTAFARVALIFYRPIDDHNLTTQGYEVS